MLRPIATENLACPINRANIDTLLRAIVAGPGQVQDGRVETAAEWQARITAYATELNCELRVENPQSPDAVDDCGDMVFMRSRNLTQGFDAYPNDVAFGADAPSAYQGIMSMRSRNIDKEFDVNHAQRILNKTR